MRYLFALLMLLPACGGGGGDPAPPPQAGFEALFTLATAAPVTFFDALPTAGAAHYRGQAELNLPLQMAAPQPYLGDLVASVTFGVATDSITGTITGLQGAGPPVTGVLTLAGGQLYPQADALADYQFTASVAGDLAQSGTIHQVTGVMTGDFTGQNGANVAGLAYGAIVAGHEVDIFDGRFVATLQN